MAHIHTVIDDDPHFKIDVLSREISCTVEEKTVLIQGDHNSERFTFDIPKEIDGHDLTQCNLIRVHFINVSADDKNTTSPGIYEVTDLEESKEDPNTLVFSWLIEREATTYVGTLNFIVEFICKTDNIIDYAWHTAICSDAAIIATGLDNSEIIIGEYYDTLDTWIARIEASGKAAENIAIEAINEVRTDALNRINEVVNETTRDFETDINDRADKVKEEISIHAVDVSGIIAQEKGANTDKVMSQKVVTEELNGLDTKVSTSLATMRSDELAYRTELRKEIVDLAAYVNYDKLVPSTGKYGPMDIGIPHAIVSRNVRLDGNDDAYAERKFRIEFVLTLRRVDDGSVITFDPVDMRIDVGITLTGNDTVEILSKCRFTAIIEKDSAGADIQYTTYYKINGEEYSTTNTGFWDEWMADIDSWPAVCDNKYEIESAKYSIVDEDNSIDVYVPAVGEPGSINIAVTATGIDSITKTSSNGNENTYNILLTDGREIPFTVKDGVGISNIERIDSGDYADTYRINLTNGNNTIFVVPNANSVGIITSDSGPTIHAADLIPLEHTIKTKVRSKNLIPYPYNYNYGTINGVTFTPNEDGSITAVGTVGDGVFANVMVCKSLDLESGKTYYIGNSPNLLLAYKDEVGTMRYLKNQVFTWKEEYEYVRMYIQYSPNTVVNETVYPMLCESNVMVDFVPYVNASDVTLTRCGKNLIPTVSWTQLTENGITFTKNDDGSITVNGTATALVVKTLINEFKFAAGVTYTLSGCPSGGGVDTYRLDNTDRVADDGASATVTYTSDTIQPIRIRIASGASLDNLVFRPQLEVGDTATAYEKYVGTEYPISLNGTPINPIRSLSPITNLVSNKKGVIIDATYNVDLTAAFNKEVAFAKVYRHGITIHIGYYFDGSEELTTEWSIDATGVIYSGRSTPITTKEELYSFLINKQSSAYVSFVNWTGTATWEDYICRPLRDFGALPSKKFTFTYLVGDPDGTVLEESDQLTIAAEGADEGYRITITDRVADITTEE